MTDVNSITSEIHDCTYKGERPLYAWGNTALKHVRFIPGEESGESALKHAHDILVKNCQFEGKYPFWHSDRVIIEDSLFTPNGRAAIWYTHDLEMRYCVIEAPKMFRRATGLTISDSKFTDAGETLWNCADMKIRNTEFYGADYILAGGQNLELDHVHLEGGYALQDTKNVTIRNSFISSKDAFWDSENVTVYDSVLESEYLGWHSKNLTLINCTIRGGQVLCYADNLVMKNCSMENAGLCFEYSTLNAEIVSDIVSIKNPAGGSIRAHHIGEIIIDEHCVNLGACKITETAEESI